MHLPNVSHFLSAFFTAAQPSENVTFQDTETEETSPLLMLPQEIICYIFTFLSNGEFARTCELSKRMHALSCDNIFWKNRYVRAFPDHLPVENPIFWKHLYGKQAKFDVSIFHSIEVLVSWDISCNVTSCALQEDSIFASNREGNIYGWNLKDNKEFLKLSISPLRTTSTPWVSSIAVEHNYLVAGGIANSALTLWNWKNQTKFCELQATLVNYKPVAIKSNFHASTVNDRNLIVRDLITKEIVFEVNEEKIIKAIFLQKNTIISCLEDRVKAWDLQNKQLLYETVFPQVDYLKAALFQDVICFVGRRNSLTIWNLKTGKCLHSFNEKIKCSAVAIYKSIIVAGTLEGKIIVWDLNEKKFLHQMKEHTEAVETIAIRGLIIETMQEEIAVRNPIIVSGSRNGEVIVWKFSKPSAFPKKSLFASFFNWE